MLIRQAALFTFTVLLSLIFGAFTVLHWTLATLLGARALLVLQLNLPMPQAYVEVLPRSMVLIVVLVAFTCYLTSKSITLGLELVQMQGEVRSPRPT